MALVPALPEKNLGGDVFEMAVSACLFHGDVNLGSATSALSKVDFKFPVSFIDEAQRLLIEHRCYFLSTDGTKQRSAFLALLKEFTGSTVVNRKLGFPVFSGTGLSIDELTAHSGSGMAKRPQIDDTEPYFAKFEPLGADAVKEYLRVFLALDKVGKEVSEHVAKWLRGRPRWTATFLETYLVRTRTEIFNGTRGRFSQLVLPGSNRAPVGLNPERFISRCQSCNAWLHDCEFGTLSVSHARAETPRQKSELGGIPVLCVFVEQKLL
jgi:hypothetical protein